MHISSSLPQVGKNPNQYPAKFVLQSTILPGGLCSSCHCRITSCHSVPSSYLSKRFSFLRHPTILSAIIDFWALTSLSYLFFLSIPPSPYRPGHTHRTIFNQNVLHPDSSLFIEYRQDMSEYSWPEEETTTSRDRMFLYPCSQAVKSHKKSS
jgi:hypothetical protein